jgi:hypothetical protein
MADTDEFIDYEPHNPLLDIDDDDPLKPDISAEDCEEQLQDLFREFSDVLVDELPEDRPAPFRPVNHRIPLVDPDQHVHPRVYPIPDRYKAQFAAHASKFVGSGWWSPAALESACAMFAVPKHDKSQARFVINLKPRNANTRKMTSSLPDMRSIRVTVASHPYRSKLDFKSAYEQVRVHPDDVKHTGFATPLGTFVSHVMQQGDCNAPETMHRVVFMMFRRCIGRFLEGFYDDVFVFSHTRRAHLRYLRIVFTTLRWYRFLLARSKVSCLSPQLEALGTIIGDEGIAVDPAKWDKVKSWPTPRNPKDILRFKGVVQWMADHLPHASELAAPITRLTGKVDWNWTPACDFAFSELKALVPRTLKPLDWDKVDAGLERVFLFTDASMFGCGGWLGQGPTRETAVPFRYHSAKFTPAQRNYSTTDQELLAVLECVVKFRDHLIGRKFTVVSDHMALKTYWEQPPKQTRRHVRMWDTLSGYDFDWEFTAGRDNVFADALSRLHELDETEDTEFVVEPDPDDLYNDEPFVGDLPAPTIVAISALVFASISASCAPVAVAPLTLPLAEGEMEQVLNSESKSLPLTGRTALLTQLPAQFLDPLAAAYKADPLFGPIFANVSDYPSFALVDDALFFEDREGWRLVLPQGRTLDDSDGKAPSFREAAIQHAHETLGHLGPAKTLSYLRHFFYWPHLHRDVFDYCRSCEQCARGKSASSAPFGLLHPNRIPQRPWSWASLDFVLGLPPVPYKGEIVDSCLTVTDMFSKMVRLFPLPSTATASQVADIYHDGVYRLHGMQEGIVSDRDPKFTAGFWRALHRKIGTKLGMSSSAHPQTDGQSEVTNKTVGQIFRIFAEDNPDDWASRSADVEFAINSASSSATTLAPFETTYGFLPTSLPVDSWTTTGNLGADGFGERIRLNWLRATDALIASRVEMVTQGNKHRRRDSPQFEVGNLVYVSTKDISFPEALARKFVPKFIGPYPITATFPSSSNYDIDFPPHLRIHPRIHASKLRPHFPNDDSRFPSRAFDKPPPVAEASDNNTAEYVIEKVVGDKHVGKERWFKVRWLGYSIAEDSWIREGELRATAAESVDDYLALVVARKAAHLGKRRGGRKGIRALLSSLTIPLVSSFGGVGARIGPPNNC